MARFRVVMELDAPTADAARSLVSGILAREAGIHRYRHEVTVSHDVAVEEYAMAKRLEAMLETVRVQRIRGPHARRARP